MKKRSLIFMVSIFVLASLFSCGSKEKEESKRALEQERIVNNLKATLINRYNPIILPSDQFRTKKIFTFDLQNFLISKEQKPVLFEGYLDDITKDGDNFTAHFSANFIELKLEDFLMHSEESIKFHLKCKYEDFKTIIENSKKPQNQEDMINSLLSLKPGYFVVCSVKEVKKITYAISASLSSGEAEIEIHSPDIFSATGELIQLVKYPELPKHGELRQ